MRVPNEPRMSGLSTAYLSSGSKARVVKARQFSTSLCGFKEEGEMGEDRGVL